MTLNLYEAKTQLSSLVDQAAAGAEIIIAKNGKPMAKLVAIRERTERKPGRLKGKIWMSKDFDAPMPDVIDAFEAGAGDDELFLKLLLDTHAILWWVRDDRRLGREARRAIATADIVWVSSATGWEAAMKVAKDRLRLREPIGVTLIADDFTELPVTLRHTEEFLRIPRHHGDPFDRMLVAQARLEGATIVTHDRAFEAYGVPVIWT